MISLFKFIGATVAFPLTTLTLIGLKVFHMLNIVSSKTCLNKRDFNLYKTATTEAYKKTQSEILNDKNIIKYMIYMVTGLILFQIIF